MIRESMRSMWQSMRTLFTERASLAVFAGLYVVLLAALYGFIAIREATVWQVLLTLIFAALVPLAFFLLQAVIINQARSGKIDWGQALRDSTKLALVAVPIILLGLGIMWLLNRWQRHFSAPPFYPPSLQPNGSVAIPKAPLHWPSIIFAAMRALSFGVILPLLLIQLWVTVAGQNLMAFARSLFSIRSAKLLARAVAPDSVLIYAVGLIFFAVIPYVLLFVHAKIPGNKSEFALFIGRLVLVFFFILLGWLVTLATFSRNSAGEACVIPETKLEETS